MKAYGYKAVSFEGAIYCIECLPDNVSLHDERVFPVFADSEWQFFPSCDICNKIHNYVTLLKG